MDRYALLTYDRGGYKQPNPVNRIEIHQLEPKLQGLENGRHDPPNASPQEENFRSAQVP